MQFCEHERKKFVEDLRKLQAAVPLIAGATSSWLTVISELRAWTFVDRKFAILNIEKEIGMRLASELNKRDDLSNIDFKGLTRALMNLRNTWDSTAFEFKLDLISRILDPMDERLLSNYLRSQKMTPSLRLCLWQAKDRVIGLQRTGTEIQRRAETVLQTVSTMDDDVSHELVW